MLTEFSECCVVIIQMGLLLSMYLNFIFQHSICWCSRMYFVLESLWDGSCGVLKVVMWSVEEKLSCAVRVILALQPAHTLKTASLSRTYGMANIWLILSGNAMKRRVFPVSKTEVKMHLNIKYGDGGELESQIGSFSKWNIQSRVAVFLKIKIMWCEHYPFTWNLFTPIKAGIGNSHYHLILKDPEQKKNSLHWVYIDAFYFYPLY